MSDGEKIELSLEDSIDYCEFELFNTRKEIKKVNKIIELLQAINKESKNSPFTLLRQLKFAILTADEYKAQATYGEALKFYYIRLDVLESRVLELQEKYEQLTMESYTK